MSSMTRTTVAVPVPVARHTTVGVPMSSTFSFQSRTAQLVFHINDCIRCVWVERVSGVAMCMSMLAAVAVAVAVTVSV